MTRVVLISTRGTTASHVDHARGNVRASASGDELLGLLHEELANLSVKVGEFCKIASFAQARRFRHRRAGGQTGSAGAVRLGAGNGRRSTGASAPTTAGSRESSSLP